MYSDLYGSQELYSEFDQFKTKNNVLETASDILYFNLLQKQKAQAKLLSHPNNVVTSSLNHLVPSRSQKTANPTLEYDGSTVYETVSETIEGGKLKLVIQEVKPENHLEEIINLTNAIVKVETLKHKIKPEDNENEALEFLASFRESFKILTDDEVSRIKHADEQ